MYTHLFIHLFMYSFIYSFIFFLIFSPKLFFKKLLLFFYVFGNKYTNHPSIKSTTIILCIHLLKHPPSPSGRCRQHGLNASDHFRELERRPSPRPPRRVVRCGLTARTDSTPLRVRAAAALRRHAAADDDRGGQQ